MTDPYIEKVQAYHCKIERSISNTPVIPSDQDVDRQIRNMREALAELCFVMKEDKIPQIARCLANLLYAVFSTAISYGIPMHSIFGELHQAIMRCKPPQINDILKRHGWKHNGTQVESKRG